MQALLQKQQQSQMIRSILAGGGEGEGRIYEKTVEEKVEHCSHLQYVMHQQLFAVSYTSLHKAAAENSLMGVKFFLTKKNKGYTPIDTFDKHGNTALHCAAEKGCNDVIRLLLDEKCDPDARSAYDNTPLMLACKESRVETIALLLEAGAILIAQNKAGLNCVHFAAQSDHAAAIEAIATQMRFAKTVTIADHSDSATNASSGGSALDYDFIPPSHPQYTMLRALSQPSNTRLTPLHVACMANSSRAVEALVQLGAHLDMRDGNGETALHKAGRGGFHQIYKLLVGYGAAQGIENIFHQTANDLLIDDGQF